MGLPFYKLYPFLYQRSLLSQDKAHSPALTVSMVHCLTLPCACEAQVPGEGILMACQPCMMIPSPSPVLLLSSSILCPGLAQPTLAFELPLALCFCQWPTPHATLYLVM